MMMKVPAEAAASTSASTSTSTSTSASAAASAAAASAASATAATAADDDDEKEGQSWLEPMTSVDGETATVVWRCTSPPSFPSANSKHSVPGFLKDVQWSPDGIYLLCTAEDAVIRVYTVPDLMAGGISPPQVSQTPLVQLWDSSTGALRASYVCKNQYDEITSAYSIAFHPLGHRLYCGLRNRIRIFDVSQPAADCTDRPLTAKVGGKRKWQKYVIGQRGVVSCIDVCPDLSGLYAVGSYHGSVCVYDDSNGEELFGMYDAHPAGVSHVRFSPDGRFLVSGGRKDDFLQCWDVRNTRTLLAKFPRTCRNNQKMPFHFDRSGRFLITGCQSTKGRVLIYDVYDPHPAPLPLVLSRPRSESASDGTGSDCDCTSDAKPTGEKETQFSAVAANVVSVLDEFVPVYDPLATIDDAQADVIHAAQFYPYFSVQRPWFVTSSGSRHIAKPRCFFSGGSDSNSDSSDDSGHTDYQAQASLAGLTIVRVDPRSNAPPTPLS